MKQRVHLHLCLPFLCSGSLHLRFSVWLHRWINGRLGGDWILAFPAQGPPLCVEGEGMVEGLWWCGWWCTDGRCRGLVPTTAGSGRVGIWVLEVDSPMSCCMCRVLSVCFWHLFCYITKKRLNISLKGCYSY